MAMRRGFALCDDSRMNLRRVRHAFAIPPDCVGRISVLRVACAPRSVAIGRPIAIRMMPVQKRNLTVDGRMPIRLLMAIE